MRKYGECLGKLTNAAHAIFALLLKPVRVVRVGFGKLADNAKIFHTLGPAALGPGNGTAAADEVPDPLMTESRLVRGLGVGAVSKTGGSTHVVGGVPTGLGVGGAAAVSG